MRLRSKEEARRQKLKSSKGTSAVRNSKKLMLKNLFGWCELIVQVMNKPSTLIMKSMLTDNRSEEL